MSHQPKGNDTIYTMDIELLTIEEAAKVLRLTKNTLRKYLHQGKIKCVRYSDHKIYFTQENLREFITERTGTFTS